MERVTSVLQCIMPIFVAVLLGMLARRKQMLKQEEIKGLQQFVMKFGLPCVLFGSCISADISSESVGTFALVLPFMALATVWAFKFGRKRFPFHNLPQLFCAQETGMLGIPLFMILFGADQAYRMGILDIAQMPTAFPTIAILTASVGESPSTKELLKKIVRSPLLIMSALGLVGYNFTMAKGHRKAIFQISALHLVWTVAFGGIIQLILLLIPNVDPLTRWSVLMYTTLPASYLAPSLGRSEDDYAMASGVCSIPTVFSLIVFCVIAVIVA